MVRWRKLGLIAGGGALPVRLAQKCTEQTAPFFVVRLKGFSDPVMAEFPGAECGLGEAGKLIRLLKENECDGVVMAGLVQRPNFAALTPDWRGAALLPKIASAAAHGDGALLNVIVETFEAEGLTVIGAEEVMAEIAASAGPLGQHVPDESHFADMRKAAALIQAIGPYDIGQGAIVSGGHVLAIEAAEGTDAMLARCADLPAELRGEGRARGVLVKRPKPMQELRVDLPTIGLETVRRARLAGLAGIAVEAGRAIIMDAEAAVAAADEAGIFIYGFRPAEMRGV